MTRANETQITVFNSILRQLRTELGLNERQCFPVSEYQAVPKQFPGGDFFVTVAMPGGPFMNPEEQVPANLTEDAETIVSAYSRVRLDSTASDQYMLFEDARGLLQIKAKILLALVGQDLMDDEGNTFLRQTAYAKQTEGPMLSDQSTKNLPLGVVRVSFGVPFDWDLTGVNG